MLAEFGFFLMCAVGLWMLGSLAIQIVFGLASLLMGVLAAIMAVCVRSKK